MPVPGSLTSLLRRKRARHSFSQRLLIRGVSVFLGLGTICSGTSSSLAQITSDGSVNSQVYDNPLDFIFHLPNCTIIPNCTAIRGGQLEGDNLFHSFSQFTINAGENVYLGVPPLSILPTLFPNVENIFIRVTGPNAAGIDGNLSVSQNFVRSPNVFFLSPQGIDIGHNARLAYPSNFLFSTAEKLDFGGGAIFDAKAVNLLTLSSFGNLPVALQMGDSAGPINFSNSNPFSQESIDIPKTRHQFTVVGDKINFDNVEISTPGDLNLLSIQNNQTVNFSSSNSEIIFPASLAVLADDVNLTNSSLLATSLSNLNDAGRIKVFGEDLRLIGNSEINTITALQGGNIELDLEANVRLENASKISSQTNPTSGIAGDILINNTGEMRLSQNSQINSSTAVSGGNIELNSGLVTLQDQSRIITASMTATADAGNISIISGGDLSLVTQARIETSSNADGGEINLTVFGDAFLAGSSQISTSSSATGAGGSNIALDATGLVELDSQAKIITQATTPTANAGNITLSAGRLNLLDRNVISTQTNSVKGDVTVIVSGGDVQVDTSSRIVTTAQNSAAIAGNILLTSDSLSVINSGNIISGLNGFTSGNITIDLSDNLDIGSSGEIATGANLLSNPVMGSSAGNLLITGANLSIGGAGKLYTLTENLGGDLNLDFSGDISVIDPDSLMAVLAAGAADAGTLDLQADNLDLSNQGKIFSSTSQGGGDLNLSLGQDVSLNTGSSITSNANEGSGGSAGDLNLSAGNLTIDGDSSIVFSLTENGGGNINLNLTDDITQTNGAQLGTFLTSNGDTISGDTGSLSLQARNLNLNNNADIITETANGHGDIDIDLTGDLSVTGGSLGNSEIITKLSTTKGAAGNISISANNVNFDQGFLLTETDQPGGNINVDATNAIQFDQSLIRLSSTTGTGHTGNLSLESQSSVAPVGILLINTEVFNEATNTGGNVALTAQSEVEMRDGSYISIDSSGVNGNFTVAASAFRSNNIGADNDVLLNQGTLNNLSLPVEVTGFDPSAEQVVRVNANSELLPNPFPPPVAPPVIPPIVVTPPSPPELPGLPSSPVIPSSPEPQDPLPSAIAPSGNNAIVEPLDTPTSRPTPPETNSNAPPPYSEFRYLSSQTENFLTVEDLLAFYGSAQSSSSNFQPRSCLASGPSSFKISGRGGIDSSPSSLHGSSQSLADLGQFDGDAVSDSSTDFLKPVVESSEPSSHWREAQAWRKNQQGKINLIAQSNLALAQPKTHSCQSLP